MCEALPALAWEGRHGAEMVPLPRGVPQTMSRCTSTRSTNWYIYSHFVTQPLFVRFGICLMVCENSLFSTSLTVVKQAAFVSRGTFFPLSPAKNTFPQWTNNVHNFLLKTQTSAYTRKCQLADLLSLCGTLDKMVMTSGPATWQPRANSAPYGYAWRTKFDP